VRGIRRQDRRRGLEPEVLRRARKRKKVAQEAKGPPGRGGGGGGAPVLLFKADVAQVPVVDADDAVVLPEEALLLGLASFLQTLDQQAQSPERCRGSRERGGGASAREHHHRYSVSSSTRGHQRSSFSATIKIDSPVHTIRRLCAGTK